eukprot:4239767-Prymnesium_polylepis.1
MRPAPTRFCGYSYMLSREEEIKPSLQRVVVSQQYAAHNFDRQEGGDPAKDLHPLERFLAPRSRDHLPHAPRREEAALFRHGCADKQQGVQDDVQFGRGVQGVRGRPAGMEG